jgi:hypothetical protein
LAAVPGRDEPVSSVPVKLSMVAVGGGLDLAVLVDGGVVKITQVGTSVGLIHGVDDGMKLDATIGLDVV